MKTLKICFILIVTFSLIAWAKESFDFGHIAKVLPLCSGREPSFWYDLVGGISLVLLCLWGLRRVKSIGQEKSGELKDTQTTDTDHNHKDQNH